LIGSGILARRYAKALFDLGRETGSPAALLEELDALAELVEEHRDFARVIFTPLYPREQRRGVVKALAERLELSAGIRAFLLILVDENRTVLLLPIRDELKILVDRAAGRLQAQITSARELRPEELTQLKAALARRVNAELTLEVKVDPQLIGGVVARVGDLLLDGSVRTQLASLAESLRRGAV
jgi:F-type H+-transporting ATPase subunit delta